MSSKIIIKMFLSILFFALFFFYPSDSQAATESIRVIRQDCTGYTNCYTSLSAWEAAEQRDLTASDEIAVARIEGVWTSADATAVIIDGWTTDATRYVKIYTASEARHAGVWSDTKYRLDVPANYAYVLSVLEPYTKIEGLQIRRNGGSGTRNIIYLNAASIEFSYGIVTKSTATVSSGINAYSAAPGTKVFNTIVYNVDEFGLQGSASVYFYNNTVINSGTYGIRGVSYSGTAISCKNNLVKGSLSGDFYHTGSGTLTCVNSASADSTATLYGASNLASKIFTFVDEANTNFHLSSSDTSAINAGIDLSLDPNLSFTTDIDGETRSGSWDIGADEVSGVTAPPPVYQCSDSTDNDGDGLTDYPNDPGCSSTSDNDETNVASDTTPPTRSNSSPSGSLASSTTSTTISLSTNETATCKYGTIPNVPYSSITSTFTSTNSTSHSQAISGLQNGQSYIYYVRCQDSSSNANTDDYAVSFSVATLVADTQIPSIPTNLSAIAISSTQINLSWASSTDNTAVTGYKIYRNGTQVITTTSTSYSSVGLTASTTYSYTVSAYDAAGNDSGQTASVSATTLAQTVIIGAPIILYTDITSGPNTGGENNNGVFVRVFGKNFGSMRGTSVVTIGGGAADNYPTWSDTEISFQLGTNAQTGNIVVTTSNGTSNGLPFTVRSGNIYFVDINSPNNPGSGTYTDPWRSPSSFYNNAQPGDTMYMRAGTYSGQYGYQNWGAIFGIRVGTTAGFTRSGTETMPIAYLAYPGETITLSAPGPTGLTRAFRLVMNSTAEQSADWIVVGNFKMISYDACIAIGGNPGLYALGWRIVNNDCLGLTRDTQAQTGTIVPGGDYAKVLGNKIYGGRTGNKLDHAIYSQACGDQVELAWNHIYDNNFAQGPLISINYEGTRCTARGDGYAGNIYVHDNIIDATNYPSRGVYSYEQDWDDGDPILPMTYVYNNIFINTGTNSSDPLISQNGALVVRNGGMEAYNNSFFNNQHTCLEFSGPTPNIEQMIFRNNICHMKSTATSYIGYPQNTPASYDIRDNIYYGLGNYSGSLDVAPINADPLYSNSVVGDLTLQSGSPAIDKVSSLVSALVVRDFNGVSRPQGSAYDIGAYEYCTECTSAIVVTSDTTPPSFPANLSATAISSTQINLSWASSTDNTAVTGYRIYRGGTQIATSVTTTYSDANLTASTAYTYTVAAYDAAGNVSTQSSSITTTTQAPPDTTAPNISSISSTTTTSSSTITFTTNEPSDTQIEYGLTTSYGSTSTLDTTLTTSHSQTISSLTPNTTYNYRILTKDSQGNTATSSNYTFTTQSVPDTTTPSTISNLSISSIGQTSLTLSWTVPTDTSGVSSYDIRYNTASIDDSNFSSSTQVSNIPIPATQGTTQTQYISVGLTPSTAYYFAIKSKDSLNNESSISNIAQATTQTAPSTTSDTPSTTSGTVSIASSGGGFIIYQVSDSQAPSTPSNFKANALDGQISLSWSNPADSDFIRVKLLRKTDGYSNSNTDGTLIYEGQDQLFTDTNLQNNQAYYYSLYAYDSIPNYSTPNQISTTPQSTITQTQTSTAKTTSTSSSLKEGDLIRGPDKIKVYIINAYDYKRHIFNPEVFNMYGHFKWENIKDVDQTTLDSYKTSDLYRADGDSKVFSLQEIDESQGKAQKRWFNTSADKFQQLGYNFDQVFIINPKERDFYQEGTPITDDEQTTTTTLTLPALVKTKENPQVYFISANKIKKPIINETVFNSYKQNNWQDIKEISQEELDKYPIIQGILYQGKVYIIDQASKTKTPIQDEQEFQSKGLDWARIMTVNEVEVGEWR